MNYKRTTAEIVIGKSLIYFKNEIVNLLGLTADSKIKFTRIDGKWYLGKDNGEGQGIKVYHTEKQIRVMCRKYINMLRKLAGAERGKYLIFQMELTPMINNGQQFFPLAIA